MVTYPYNSKDKLYISFFIMLIIILAIASIITGINAFSYQTLLKTYTVPVSYTGDSCAGIGGTSSPGCIPVFEGNPNTSYSETLGYTVTNWLLFSMNILIVIFAIISIIIYTNISKDPVNSIEDIIRTEIKRAVKTSTTKAPTLG